MEELIWNLSFLLSPLDTFYHRRTSKRVEIGSNSSIQKKHLGKLFSCPNDTIGGTNGESSFSSLLLDLIEKSPSREGFSSSQCGKRSRVTLIDKTSNNWSPSLKSISPCLSTCSPRESSRVYGLFVGFFGGGPSVILHLLPLNGTLFPFNRPVPHLVTHKDKQ